jgi:hypothetical protein
VRIEPGGEQQASKPTVNHQVRNPRFPTLFSNANANGAVMADEFGKWAFQSQTGISSRTRTPAFMSARRFHRGRTRRAFCVKSPLLERPRMVHYAILINGRIEMTVCGTGQTARSRRLIISP